MIGKLVLAWLALDGVCLGLFLWICWGELFPKRPTLRLVK